LSSTYVTWALVLLAIVAGIWVLTRKGDSAKPDEPATDVPTTGEGAMGRAVPADESRTTARVTPLHEVTAVGRPAGDATTTDEIGRVQVPPPVPSGLGLWSDGYAQSVRERWRDLQLRFIDDPQFVANEAEQVVEETVEALTASLNAFKGELDAWRSGPGDTEQLRTAVYRYRDFLDRLLGQ
jgi:hypothetical protein